MPDNQGEKQREIERKQEKASKAAKAKKELADAVRLAAELRVRNQTAIVNKARNWAEGLFNTFSMSGPEFEDWKAEGLAFLGDKAGRAADVARSLGTRPRDGYVTVRGDGKVIARHKTEDFLFTTELKLPWVGSVSNVEFTGLAASIESDDGDGAFGTGDDPEPIDDDPNGTLSGISRRAETGGIIDPTFIPDANETRNTLINRSRHVNLSEGTRGELGAQAALIGRVMANAKELAQLGEKLEVPKVATPWVDPDTNVPIPQHVLTEPKPEPSPEPAPPPKPDAGTNRKGQMGRKPRPATDGTTDPAPNTNGKGQMGRQQAKLKVEMSKQETEVAVFDLQELLESAYGKQTPTVVGAAAAIFEARKILKGLGIQGRYFTKDVGGKTHVIIKGRRGLRAQLSGTRYLASNPKMVRSVSAKSSPRPRRCGSG
jgi:hypothetical protein